MATNISILRKIDLGIGRTLSEYSNITMFERAKNAFFKKITGLTTTRPSYNTEKPSVYNGGFLIGKADLMKMIEDEKCEGLHVSFAYKPVRKFGIIQHQTHLVFQKVNDNGGEFLDLDTDIIFSTDPNGGNSPDPVLHCPGPNCNP